MNQIKKFYHGLFRVEEWLGRALLFAMIFVVVIQVFFPVYHAQAFDLDGRSVSISLCLVDYVGNGTLRRDQRACQGGVVY